MYTSQNSLRTSISLAAVLLIAAGAAQAAGASSSTTEAQVRFRQEMAVCDSGQSQQPVQTCRTEARNALAEARRGGLTSAPEQLNQNAIQRCMEFIGDDRVACEARIRNPSRVEGSVKGGGVLRESVILSPAK